MLLPASDPQWNPPSFPWQLLACAAESGWCGWAAAEPRGLSGLCLTLPPARAPGSPCSPPACLTTADMSFHMLLFIGKKSKKASHCCIFSSEPCIYRVCPSQLLLSLMCPLLSAGPKPLEGKGTEGPKVKWNCSTLAYMFLLLFQAEHLPFSLWEKDILFVTEWEASIWL